MARTPKVGYNLQDLHIAAGIAVLGSNLAAAEFAGVAEQTVYNRLKNNKDFMREAISAIHGAVLQSRSMLREVQAEEQLSEIRKRFDKAMFAIDKALAEGDAKTAVNIVKQIVEYDHGKPRQRLEVESHSTQANIIVIPQVEAMLGSLADTIEKAGKLYESGHKLIDVTPEKDS